MHMFPEDLPWRQAETAIDAAFPQRDDVIAVVVDGVTPDTAERAAAALAAELQRAPPACSDVARPDAEEVFRRSALLFAEEAVVQRRRSGSSPRSPCSARSPPIPACAGSRGR